MSKRQHHRGKKRPKAWHRGRTEARQWQRHGDLPDLGTGADPTTGAPSPRRRSGRQKPGDAL